jgi:glycine cleavage system aminomethyltransferase T
MAEQISLWDAKLGFAEQLEKKEFIGKKAIGAETNWRN